jgi:two-component system, cell cycle sensor histidine kinase and response regulator CckA
MPGGGTLRFATHAATPAEIPSDKADGTKRFAVLTASDTGVGMDETTRARVFEPFFTTKGPGRGTGLGLATTWATITHAGGWVKVDSSPGQGSTFTIGLPLAELGPASAAVTSPRGQVAPGAPRTVLLAEDEPGVRKVMADALRGAGWQVLEAENADAALAVARAHPGKIALLCTDGVMPGSPLSVLVEGFRGLNPEAPVLVCTGHVDEELVRRGVAEGELSLLRKPFRPPELVATVAALLKVS